MRKIIRGLYHGKIFTVLCALATIGAFISLNYFSFETRPENCVVKNNCSDDQNSKRLPRFTRSAKKYCQQAETKTQAEVKYPKNYLLVWTAKWCTSCARIKVIGSELEEEGFDVFYLDFDKNQEQASKDKIASLPTCVIYTNGKEVKRIVGTKKAETQIREVLKKNKKPCNYDIY